MYYKFIKSVWCVIIFNLYTGVIFAQEKKTPIVILQSNGNYAEYTGEILKTEGFNEYQLASINNQEFINGQLKNFDIAILPVTELTLSQASAIISYVNDGGHLIVFNPGQALLPIIGAKAGGADITGGYIEISDNHSLTKGLITQPLQIHAKASGFQLTTARKIASFYDAQSNKSIGPAVCLNKTKGGNVISFFFNFPQSILYTRQGNPGFAGKEKDSIPGLRAMDLFTDGWVDTSKNCLNQADEQMRLLSKSIEYLSERNRPYPRTWYFPDNLSSLVTLNNDGEYSKEEDFIEQLKDVSDRDARMTIYILETGKVSKTFTDSLIKKGFEIAAHPDATKHAEHPTWDIVNTAIAGKLNELKTLHGITNVLSNVNHWFVWCGTNEQGMPDFTAGAKIEEQNGIELDANYAHYDNGSNQNKFLGATGNRQGSFTGTALPMKFCDTDGKLVNVYQHVNNVYDQQYMELEDKQGFFECFKGLLDRSIDEDIYSYVSIKAHNDEYYFSKEPLLKMLDYAKTKKIPVWTESKLLGFLKAKDALTFENFNWENKTFAFDIKSPLACEPYVTITIPVLFKNKKIKKIMIDGKETTSSYRTIRKTSYAVFNIATGKNYEVKVLY